MPVIGAIGAGVVVVVVTVLALLSASPRWGSFSRHDPSVQANRRIARWGVQILDGFGYAFPQVFLSATSLPSPCDGDDREWRAAQLVLVSTEEKSMVFDCLVLGNDVGDLDRWFSGAPVTLRAHPSAGLTPVAEVDQAVARWIETGSTVSIAMDDEEGVPTLRIADDDAVVALELDAASA